MALGALSGTAAVVLAVLLGAGVVLAPAHADDDPLPLPVLPSEVSESPGYVEPRADPTGTPERHQLPDMSVSPPSQKQIDDARAALERLRNQGKSTPTTLTKVAGPTADDEGSLTSRISDEGWWTIGAGLLVLLVASETTRLSLRRAKHRKQA